MFLSGSCKFFSASAEIVAAEELPEVLVPAVLAAGRFCGAGGGGGPMAASSLPSRPSTESTPLSVTSAGAGRFLEVFGLAAAALGFLALASGSKS
eukprot:9533913-Lingulodinium_polyedra.AAC.2